MPPQTELAVGILLLEKKRDYCWYLKKSTMEYLISRYLLRYHKVIIREEVDRIDAENKNALFSDPFFLQYGQNRVNMLNKKASK